MGAYAVDKDCRTLKFLYGLKKQYVWELSSNVETKQWVSALQEAVIDVGERGQET